MAMLSLTRQQAVTRDVLVVHRVYEAACVRFGRLAVEQDLTLLWTMRCMWGVQEVLPFDATASRTAREWLYVARTLCGYGAHP